MSASFTAEMEVRCIETGALQLLHISPRQKHKKKSTKQEVSSHNTSLNYVYNTHKIIYINIVVCFKTDMCPSSFEYIASIQQCLFLEANLRLNFSSSESYCRELHSSAHLVIIENQEKHLATIEYIAGSFLTTSFVYINIRNKICEVVFSVSLSYKL